MIAVVNAKDWPNEGEYIGWAKPPRFPVSSPLANPFIRRIHSGEMSREEGSRRYHDWLRGQWKVNGKAKDELYRLARKHMAGENVVLICWCGYNDPLCHGRVVAEAVAGVEKKLKEQQKPIVSEEPNYPNLTLSNESAMVHAVTAAYDEENQALVAALVVTNEVQLLKAIRASLAVNRKNSLIHLNGQGVRATLLGARMGYQVVTLNLEGKVGALGTASFLLHPLAGNPTGREKFYIVTLEHEDPYEKFIQRLMLATPWGYREEWADVLYRMGEAQGLFRNLPVVGVPGIIRSAIEVKTDGWSDVISTAIKQGEIWLT